MVDKKVAVVTGASAGVGRATAVALSREGYDVALLARGHAGLDGAAADVRAEGCRALGHLRHPVDRDRDHGAHGSFGGKAGGFWDPSFLNGLPATGKTFVQASGRTIRGKTRRFER